MAQDPAQLPPQQLADLAAITTAAKQLGLEVARIDATSPQPAAMALIDKKLALEHRIVPIKLDGKTLIVAVGDPSLLTKPAPAFMQGLKQQGYALKIFLTPGEDFALAVGAYDAAPKSTTPIAPATQPPASAATAPASPPPATPVSTGPAPVAAAPIASTPASQTAQAPATSKAPTPVAAPVPPSVPTSIPVVSLAAQPAVPASVLSAQVPQVDLLTRTIRKDALERFPEDVAKKYQIVVFELSPDGKEASVAAVKPDDQRIRDILKYVEERNGIRIHLYQTTPQGFAKAMTGYVGGTSSAPTAPTPPLQRASLDKVKSAAQAPVAPTSVVSRPAAPATGGVVPAPVAAVAAPVSSGAPSQSPQTPTAPSGDDMPAIALNQLQNQTGLSINPSTASGKAAMVQLVSGDEQTNLDQVLGAPITDFNGFEQTLKTGLIPKVVAAIVSFASAQKASDIHIEPGETAVRIRYRVDGKLRNIIKLPIELHAPLVSRIKILSKLKIDEARLPQDGRFNVQVGGHEIDLRVSTLPAIHGEKVVIRILDKTAGVKQLSALGLVGMNLKRITEGIQEPYGIILVTGPTGSGKSTTLYAMLTEINHPDVNVITLEDPVEYQIEGINQTQVKPAIGYSFADGLRSILRQDPNVIMVGEIRDSETAALATQAALTGHLVLSTLHTNNAAGAIPRLIDMEVEPFLLASSLDIIIAQRLVRQLCQKCKVAAEVPAETLATIKAELELSPVPAVKDLTKKPFTFFGPGSCEECTDGYKGRLGIYEVIAMSEPIAQLAIKQASGAEIEALARKEGMLSLRQDGILKALEGQTSIDEVLQATSE